MNEKEFVPIKGYEGFYEINYLGVVKNVSRLVTRNNAGSYYKEASVKISSIDKHGYYSIMLSKNGNNTRYKIHRLIAIHFIPNPKNRPCVRHLNDIKTDNRLENLAWGTYSQNKHDAVANGKHLINENHKMAKLTNDDVIEIRKLLKTRLTHDEISKRYNVSRGSISKINNRQTWFNLK